MCMPKKAASTGREEPGYRVDSLVAITEATSSQSPPTKSWIYRDRITFRHEPYVSGYNLSLVKRGEPQRAAAVAGVDQRLRVGLPGGRDIVAIDVRNPAGRTVPQIPEPEIPHPSIQFAVGKPTAVGRRGGISRIIRR